MQFPRRARSASARRRRRAAAPQGSLLREAHELSAAAPEKRGRTRGAEEAAARKPAGRCERCDGNHKTQNCPHFKQPRDEHPDAKGGSAKKKPRRRDGSTSPGLQLRRGRVVLQPPDGSCLFHSLRFGLIQCEVAAPPESTAALRKALAEWVGSHPDHKIADTPVSDWVKWDSNLSPARYAKKMARGSAWGGGIEMAACSQLHSVSVWVYERRGGGFERISCFDSADADAPTVHILYKGGVHYDALIPDAAEVASACRARAAEQAGAGSRGSPGGQPRRRVALPRHPPRRVRLEDVGGGGGEPRRRSGPPPPRRRSAPPSRTPSRRPPPRRAAASPSRGVETWRVLCVVSSCYMIISAKTQAAAAAAI